MSLSVIAAAAPHEMVWLRIRSDAKLDSLLAWSEFAAPKGQTMLDAVTRVAHQGGLTLDRTVEDFPVNQDLHLYRLEPLDLSKTIEELGVGSGERLYLTNDDLLER